MALVVSLCGVSYVEAAEGPVFSVGVIDTHEIATVTPETNSDPDFRPHINFPYLKRQANGTLEVYYNYGQTQSGVQFAARAFSSDGGQTWYGHTGSVPSLPASLLVKPSGQTSHGVSLGFNDAAGRTNWNNTYYSSTDGGANWGFSNANFDSGGVSYTSTYNSFSDIVESGSTFFHVSQGKRIGESTFESILWASTNGGANWTRRATIAQHTTSINYGAMGSEGPSETSLVELNNGNLLSVFRTGQPFPSTDVQGTDPSLFWSMSTDGGYTWSNAKSLGISGVFPLLHKLDDGSVALTYGRYGARMVLADETGLRWSTPKIVYDGPGSGHTDLRKGSNGEYVFVYDQSSFYPPGWNASPPAGYQNIEGGVEIGHLKAARLDITRQTATDDYLWAYEFHGDNSPDSVSNQWAVTSGGSLSGYAWAEHAQDFYRMDTAQGGAGSYLYYTMNGNGGGSPWDAMSFDEGVVIDLRARVEGSVAEGAAGLVFGDGVNGYAMIELTDAGVILQGDGDNAGQVLFSETASFTTDQWHDYRIIIREISGVMTAELYLDDSATTILSKALNNTYLDSIYFGDLTTGASGIMDVDYLRFASLASVPAPESGILLAAMMPLLLGWRRSVWQRA